MAVGPSAFGCGATRARAMWFFTVFVFVSVNGKLLRLQGGASTRRTRVPGRRAASADLRRAKPAAGRSLQLFGCRMKQL
jgi:hypothetical protein